jgi:hypothetical protein
MSFFILPIDKPINRLYYYYIDNGGNKMTDQEKVIEAIKDSRFNPDGKMARYSEMWDYALLRTAESLGYFTRKFYKHLRGQEVYTITQKGLALI